MKYSRALSGAGGFTAVGPLWTGSEGPNTGFNKMARSIIQPGRTELWVLRDRVPLFGGIIWAVGANIDNRTITLTGKDHFSYLDRRALNKTHVFTAADQFTMIKTLVDYMNTATGGDIGLTVPSTTSGTTRTRRFDRNEFRRYGDIVREMSKLDSGFDFGVDFAGGVQSGFTKQLTLANRRGKKVSVTFEIGKNVELLNYEEDAWGMANSVIGIGSGEGTEQINTVSTKAASLNTYPLLEDALSFKTIEDTTVLDAKAKDERKRRDQPIRTVKVNIVADDPDSRLGAFDVGDDVRLFAKYGYIDVDEQFRIMSMDVTINEAGKETIGVDLTPLEFTT
jgi:hypothetical protein